MHDSRGLLQNSVKPQGMRVKLLVRYSGKFVIAVFGIYTGYVPLASNCMNINYLEGPSPPPYQ